MSSQQGQEHFCGIVAQAEVGEYGIQRKMQEDAFMLDMPQELTA